MEVKLRQFGGYRSSFVVLRSHARFKGIFQQTFYFIKLRAIIVIWSSSKRKYLGGRGEHFISPFRFQ